MLGLKKHVFEMKASLIVILSLIIFDGGLSRGYESFWWHISSVEKSTAV